MYSCSFYLCRVSAVGGGGMGREEGLGSRGTRGLHGYHPGQRKHPAVILLVHEQGWKGSGKEPNRIFSLILLNHCFLLEAVECQDKHYEVNIMHNGEGISCAIHINANEPLVVNFPCLAEYLPQLVMSSLCHTPTKFSLWRRGAVGSG